jgi:hypothetical protein
MSEMSRDEIGQRFTYHPPQDHQVPKYQLIRAKATELAQLIVKLTHVSREQSLALTNLEQAVMWANASIARST